MALESYLYNEELEPVVILDQALYLAHELISAVSDRCPEDLARANRFLLDAYLALEEDVKVLNTEREILDLFQAVYQKTYKFNCDSGDIWWDDNLPLGNVPVKFIRTVAKIQAQRDNAGVLAFQKAYREDS